MKLLPAYSSAQHTVEDFTGRVVCLDALELLKMLPDSSVDMVLADLPYQVTQAKWDVMIPLDAMWTELKRIAKPKAAMVFTAIQPFTSLLTVSNLPMYQYSWIWKKSRKTNFLNAKIMPLNGHEDILIFGNGKPQYYPQMIESDGHKAGANQHRGSTLYGAFNGAYLVNRDEYYPCTVIEFPHDPEMSVTYEHRPNKQKNHPTQKPVSLFEYLIKTYTVENDIVLDMTCGSGTTAIAARKTGRRFICGDNSPEYVALANTRLANSDPYVSTVLPNGMKQLSLFEAVS